MKNVLNIDQPTLKRVLYHFNLAPYYSIHELRKEMIRYHNFQNQPQNAGLTDDKKIKAFRVDRMGENQGVSGKKGEVLEAERERQTG